MRDRATPRSPSIDIRTPCPKTWGDLIGDDRRRFCEACSLHVHNAAEMTRGEAEALVADSASRVCMRLEYDGNGEPVFRDPARKQHGPAIQRWSRWMLTAAAGVMAACTNSARNPAPLSGPDATQSGSHVSVRMGTPAPVEKLGDVAMPTPPIPERLGGASTEPQPVAPDGPAPHTPRELK
jgi:hypothetical protein